jgi:O-antigen/teichoic acid export membrane protein
MGYNKINKITDSKFSLDLLWNMASFGLVAIIGILLNIIILKVYDTRVLGVFNQVFAIYLLLSQLAVGGVHLGVQRFVPANIKSDAQTKNIVLAALIVCTIISIVVIFIGFLLKDFPATILNSKAVGVGYVVILPGLLFFSWNKVLLSYHNGCRRMKAFAVFNFLRYAGILVGLLLFVIYKFDVNYLPVILSLAEACLFLVVFFYSLSFLRGAIHFKRLLVWVKIQYHFGNKALLGNFLLDVNTKVDVFILGIFLTDSHVGIYSFASTFAEGFMQLPVLLRNNINPILAKLSVKKNLKLTEKIINDSKTKFLKMIGSIGIIAIVLFPLVFVVFAIKEHRFDTWLIFSILVLFVSMSSGYQPFLMLFNQFGHPWQQTKFIFILFLSNVLLVLMLVPIIGIYGAALGTGLSFIVQVFYQKWACKRVLKFKL